MGLSTRKSQCTNPYTDESIIQAQRGRDRGKEKDQVNIKPTLCLYFLHGFNKDDKFLTFDK